MSFLFGELYIISCEKTKGKLKAEDYEKLYSDPKKYKGFEVEITGKVFSEPEKDEDGTYIQLWADPENSEKNTLAAINDPKLEIKTDDYVKIKGVVKDEFEGENAFGGTITAPMILADSIEIVDYITAVAPTLKEIKIDKEINQHGIVVTLQKIEIAKNQTRVFLKVKNGTQDNASFYSSSAKLIVGNKQLEEEYADPETTELQEVQSELLPSVETEAVIVYPALDPNEKSITLNAEASSDNYNLGFYTICF
ncbi:DUF4352 domain-containing protein [Neobacillus sp. 179-C4.2 HS]|uniref:DUF4352 domain-containing protein n=1 Tax=Neobacillus driksii TaxID=3035913 RepID=A0ABV4YYX4_9BACI|nr:DUF4352 domain-containing protein [Neobacillus sp. 179.-C4.2 HS]MDP5194639.1 DUF4352 domain-containing protein [Neobacillus sp. 179.-C4.2 HS]